MCGAELIIKRLSEVIHVILISSIVIDIVFIAHNIVLSLSILGHHGLLSLLVINIILCIFEIQISKFIICDNIVIDLGRWNGSGLNKLRLCSLRNLVILVQVDNIEVMLIFFCLFKFSCLNIFKTISFSHSLGLFFFLALESL